MSTWTIIAIAATAYVVTVAAWCAACYWLASDAKHERAPRQGAR